MTRILSLLIVLAVTSPAVAQTTDETVGAVLDAFHRAAAEADYDAYFALLADDAVFLGTDDWERWPREDFEVYARPRFDRGGWAYAATDRHIAVSDDGRTAWFDEMLDNANMGTTRGTGVLVRGEGGWKISQYNLSLPVPNELADDVVRRIRAFDARTRPPHNRIESVVDSMATAMIDSGLVAGMSVGVVHRGDTLALATYGLADLEYDIPTPAHAVYEIGSITKQFTAAGILRLVERGVLDLDADVRTYLPDLDTRGHAVPLARMLDHTSGFQGYTEMAAFGGLATRDLPRDTLVSMIESWPFWHEPGEQMIYNNSAYFLLGLLIEAVTDTTYESFLEREFFEPLGMTDSRYCSNTALVPRRMHGYTRVPGGFVRADYLNHLWPFAAGSICSSVEDLLTWNRALHGGQVLGPAAYRRMITPQPLVDGSPTRYAAGLSRVDRRGREAISHGGGINGFLSDAIHFPETGTTVVVLVNTVRGGNPTAVSTRVVEELFEDVLPTPRPIDIDMEERVGIWVGVDRGGEARYDIRWEDGTARIGLGSRGSTDLVYHGAGWFATEDGALRVGFVVGSDGVERLHVDGGGGYSILLREP